MTRTTNIIIRLLVSGLVTAALVPSAASAQPASDANERTATERGQAVGEPGEQSSASTARFSRTPTELAQRATPTELAQRALGRATPAAGPSGFDWDDAATGALIASGLILAMLVAARTRHRRTTAGSHA